MNRMVELATRLPRSPMLPMRGKRRFASRGLKTALVKVQKWINDSEYVEFPQYIDKIGHNKNDVFV